MPIIEELIQHIIKFYPIFVIIFYAQLQKGVRPDLLIATGNRRTMAHPQPHHREVLHLATTPQIAQTQHGLGRTHLPQRGLLPAAESALAGRRPPPPPHAQPQPLYEAPLLPNNPQETNLVRFEDGGARQNRDLLHRKPVPASPSRLAPRGRHLQSRHEKSHRYQSYEVGLEIEEKAFQLVLRNMKHREDLKKRDSFDQISKKGSFIFKDLPFFKELTENKAKVSETDLATTMKSISRRNARKHNEAYGKLWQIQESHTKLQQLKHSLKQNLHVKPIVKPKTPKFSVPELKRLFQIQKQGILGIFGNGPVHTTEDSQDRSYEDAIKVGEKSRYTSLIQGSLFLGKDPKCEMAYRSGKDKKPRKNRIDTNQLSQAFSMNTDLKLVDVKNYSINHSPHKELTHTINSTSLPSISANLPKKTNHNDSNLNCSMSKTKPAKKSTVQQSMGLTSLNKFANFVPERSGDKWMRYITQMKEGSYQLSKQKSTKKLVQKNLEEKYRELTPNLQMKFMTQGEESNVDEVTSTANGLSSTEKTSRCQSLIQLPVQKDPIITHINQPYEAKRSLKQSIQRTTNDQRSIFPQVGAKKEKDKSIVQAAIRTTIVQQCEQKTKRIKKKGSRFASIPIRQDKEPTSYLKRSIVGKDIAAMG